MQPWRALETSFKNIPPTKNLTTLHFLTVQFIYKLSHDYVTQLKRRDKVTFALFLHKDTKKRSDM